MIRTLIKSLIILLLIIGCDTLLEVEGICVLINTTTNANNCYPVTTESQCISDAEKNETIIIRYWGLSYDCDEYCNNKIPNEICEIN